MPLEILQCMLQSLQGNGPRVDESLLTDKSIVGDVIDAILTITHNYITLSWHATVCTWDYLFGK